MIESFYIYEALLKHLNRLLCWHNSPDFSRAPLIRSDNVVIYKESAAITRQKRGVANVNCSCRGLLQVSM
ncbi:hypothetical protein VN23_06845 [Janthinobacterium sp. B9-8]|nr:hypothetical protein VN23_06845 [Janthinobacterium sp. B9-8]